MGDAVPKSPSKDALPELHISPAVRALDQLERKYTVGGFDSLPYYFKEGKGSLLWVHDHSLNLQFPQLTLLGR